MRLSIRLGIGLALALAFALPLAVAQKRNAAPRLRASMVVQTEWLASHLEDSNVVVLHVARDRSSYDAGHIPGARFVALRDITVERAGVPNELPPVDQLKTAFERVGVGDRTRVILYGDMQGLLAARAYFTLDHLGQGDRAALLDGGLEKWKSENRPLTREEPQIKPATLTARPNPGILVHFATMKRMSDEAQSANADVVIIDARSLEEYSGQKPGEGVKRGGHIPGAKHVFWMGHLEAKDNPILKPESELRGMYAAVGVRPGKKVVTYCRTGVMASHSYFTLKFLGYEPMMYDGSFIEWSAAADTNVETGSTLAATR